MFRHGSYTSLRNYKRALQATLGEIISLQHFQSESI